MGMGLRFCLFSRKYGVYLGRHQDDSFAWSSANPGAFDRAPTFDNPGQALAALPPDVVTAAEADAWAVKDDLPGGHASVRACVNAGLPDWTPTPE